MLWYRCRESWQQLPPIKGQLQTLELGQCDSSLKSLCHAAWGPVALAYRCYCMSCRLTELLAKYAGLMRTSGGYSRPGTSNPVLAPPAPPEDGAGAVSRPATSDTALQVGAPVHQQAGTTTWLVRSDATPAPP